MGQEETEQVVVPRRAAGPEQQREADRSHAVVEPRRALVVPRRASDGEEG